MFTFRSLSKILCHRFFNGLKSHEYPVLGGQEFSRRSIQTSKVCTTKVKELQKDLDLQVIEHKIEEYPLDRDELVLEYEDFFEVRDSVKLRDLFNARVHYGHKAGCRNVYMTEYIFGSRLDIDIIDLNKTVPLLQDALNFMAHIVFKEGIILFIGRNRQYIPLIEKTAKICGEYSHCRKWQKGQFTNASRVFKDEIRLPDLCVFLDTTSTAFETHDAIVDCAKMCIPTIAVVDTNTDPRLVTYPIPGNDDSPQSIQLYCKLFQETILKAKEIEKGVKKVTTEIDTVIKIKKKEQIGKQKDTLDPVIEELDVVEDEDSVKYESKIKKKARDFDWKIVRERNRNKKDEKSED